MLDLLVQLGLEDPFEYGLAFTRVSFEEPGELPLRKHDRLGELRMRKAEQVLNLPANVGRSVGDRLDLFRAFGAGDRLTQRFGRGEPPELRALVLMHGSAFSAQASALVGGGTPNPVDPSWDLEKGQRRSRR